MRKVRILLPKASMRGRLSIEIKTIRIVCGDQHTESSGVIWDLGFGILDLGVRNERTRPLTQTVLTVLTFTFAF